MTIRIAMLGLGYWGPNLLRNLAALGGVKIVALCDLDIKRVELFQKRFCPDARMVNDYRLVADAPDIDAVVIATPLRTHHQIGSCMLAAGKHTLIEKPLASSVEECESLIQLARQHERILMVGHVFEHNVAVQRIKQYIDNVELGKLFYVYSQRVNLGRIQPDVNALWSFAPHDLSIMNYWFGQEPVRVSARGFSYLNSGIQDVVFVTLEYPNGVGAHLHIGWLDPRKVRLMTLVGSKKMLVYDDVSLEAKIRIYDKGIVNLHEFMESPETFAEFQFQIRVGDVVTPTIQFNEPLQSECQHFIDCIQLNQQPRTDGLSGLRVVRALEAADQSLREDGQQVECSTSPLLSSVSDKE